MINEAMGSESEAGREESRASVCYASYGRKGSMAMLWLWRSQIGWEGEMKFSGLSLVFSVITPVGFLETGGEKALRHNGLNGYSPFPRENDAGVALNEIDWYSIN